LFALRIRRGAQGFGFDGDLSGGRNRQFSIRPEQREMVKRWLANYQEWKRRMEEICELNHTLLRAEE